MFGSLRLWTGLITRYKKESGIHNRGTGQHGTHEDIVTGTIHEPTHDISTQPSSLASLDHVEINSRNMSQQAISPLTPLPLTRRIDLLLTLITPVTSRPGTLRIITLVDLGIRVAQFNRDIPLQFILEPNRLDPTNRLHDRGFPVGDVADGADIDGGLSADDFGAEGGEGGDVEGVWVRLFG